MPCCGRGASPSPSRPPTAAWPPAASTSPARRWSPAACSAPSGTTPGHGRSSSRRSGWSDGTAWPGTFSADRHRMLRRGGRGRMQGHQLPDVAAEGAAAGLEDGDLVVLARRGEAAAFREIMRRNNRHLFRAARSVLRDDAEAEDVVQEAYLRAFRGLAGFRGDASLSTWLTRIALNEALGRLRRRRDTVSLKDIDAINDQGEARVIYLPAARQDSDPEAAAARSEVRRLLERAVDQL